MARSNCATCGKPGELREMSACTACGQPICHECERHYDGFCANCLNNGSDVALL